MKLELKSKYKPAGDQPKAIKELVKNLNDGVKTQVLLGATGTGKTFTIANVCKEVNRPTLVLSHNKTLASQLYVELKELFPNNRVEYFISNFDYYKPEAYLPKSDTYIDKTSKSNFDIEAMRNSAINSTLLKEPVIIVASVAAIYGQMTPVEYRKMFMELKVGMKINLNDFKRDLVLRNYSSNNVEIKPGEFRARGDVFEIAPATGLNNYFRILFDGNTIEAIDEFDFTTKKKIRNFKIWTLPPAYMYTVRKSVIDNALTNIKKELKSRLKYFKENNKLLEAQRLEERVTHDIESLQEYGIVGGIENYSRFLDGRNEGEKPYTVFDYLLINAKENDTKPLLVIDESHMMIPQLNAMYNGDRARKENLVNYGFRLPSALDNRPLKFSEFEDFDIDTIFVSATPSKYELDRTSGVVVPQIVRPTGLLDPTIEIVPTNNQIEDIYDRIVKNKERTLILTVTKRMAEELSNYLRLKNIKSAYIHSEYKTFERDEILRKLRLGVFEVVIGINLIREGIDLPEVSEILVLDADKESFFRSTTSLVQIIGRAARNSNGHVVLYGDKITKSMKEAIDETDRRRKIQDKYNKENNITPKTIVKAIPKQLNADKSNVVQKLIAKRNDPSYKELIKNSKKEIQSEIRSQKGKMIFAASQHDFERAAQIRDFVLELESMIN